MPILPWRVRLGKKRDHDFDLVAVRLAEQVGEQGGLFEAFGGRGDPSGGFDQLIEQHAI